MRKAKLQVWRPLNLLRHRIFSHNVSFTEKGLIISLKDAHGSEVDIIYNQASDIIGDYVWNFYYANDILQSTFLAELMDEAIQHEDFSANDELVFYKMMNSPAINKLKQAGFADDTVKLEHHLYPVSDGIFEVVSNYEPEFRHKK